MAKFILDTNVFIQAHRSYYPFQVFPSFWEKLVSLAEQDNICSITAVKNELYQQDDELSIWCKNKLPKGFFKEVDDHVFVAYRSEVIQWAGQQRNFYKERAIANFFDADNADAWLIAHSKAYNLNLVTHEKPSDGKKEIKIPNPCMALGVDYCDTIEMLKSLKVRL